MQSMQQLIIALIMFALLIGTGLPVGAQARTDWAAGYASYLAQIKRQCPRDAGRADERAATRGALCTAPH